MAYSFLNPIPVTTVTDNGYPHPQRNAEGQWVVSASAINEQSNKVIMYDPLSAVVYPVTPYTVSMDYLSQVREYEKTLAQIQAKANVQIKGFSDSMNPNEINSIADIMQAGSADSSIVRMLTSSIPKLLDGDFKGAGEEAWEHSPVNELWDKVTATGEFIKNTLIDPITTEAKTSAKGVKLLNNALVNLGETMDYITAANAVKGAIQGGMDGGLTQAWDNVQAGYGDPYSATGRKQFDWNLKPTGTGWDTVLNIGLEILSDPTTYLTFGTSGAIKAVGKDALADVLRKSADDIGSVVIKEHADELASVAIRTFIQKDTSLANALRTAKLKNLDVTLTPELSAKFFDSVTKHVSDLKELKTLNMLKAVRGVSDAVQETAMKSVALSSALGVGYGVVKAGVASTKLGIEATSYIAAKINNLVKTSDLDKATFKTVNESVVKIERELNTMSDLFNLTNTDKVEILRRATKSFQEAKYNEVQTILNKEMESAKLYTALNEWAAKEGFDNIETFLTAAHTRSDVLPEEIVHTAQEIENNINRTIRKAQAEVINRYADELTPRKYFGNRAVDYAKLLAEYDSIYKVNKITTYVSDKTLRSIRALTQDRKLLADAIMANDSLELFNKYGAVEYKSVFNAPALSNGNEVTQSVEYIKSILADPTASSFEKSNAENMLRLIQTNDNYILLYETDMTLAKAEVISNTLDTILKQNIKAIEQKAISFADLKTVHDAINLWRRDTYAITEPIITKTNEAWGRIYSYFINNAKQYERVNITALTAKTRNNNTGALLKQVSEQLKVLAVMTEKETPRTSLQMLVSGMVSKAVNSIEPALAEALEKQGLDSSKLSEMIVNMSGVNLSDVFKTEDTAYTLNTFLQVTDLLEDMPDLTYFVREGGLREAIDEWDSKGFSIELGNDILSKLDELVYRFNAVSATDGMVNTVQSLRDEVQELIDWAYQGIENRVKTTTKTLETKLYKVKLSHVSALQQILSADGVEDIFAQIRNNYGVGSFLDALYSDSADNFTTQAIQHLQGLSKSVYVGQNFISLISKSEFSQTWKDGIYDSLAGMAQSPRTMITNVDTFTADILGKAKKFIDNKNNTHPHRLADLSSTRNVLEESENLYRHAFLEDELDQELVEYWKPLYNKLKNDTKTFNITYSAARTTKNGGNVYQFAFTLPNGTSAAYINRSVYEHMMRNINDATALELFGVPAKRARQMMSDNLKTLETRKGVQFFDTDEDMATAMYNSFYQMKQAARESDLTPRLLGYNNALYSLGTDKAISDYMYKNLLNTRILYDGANFRSPLAFETLDAAELMRIMYDGAIEVTDNMHEDMAEIVTRVKELLDKHNAGEPLAKAAIMPNFTRESTASFRELIAVIDNVRDIMSADRSSKMFRHLTEAQFNTLRLSFNMTQLESLRQTLSTILNNLGDTMSSIHQSNQVLGQTLLIQSAMTTLLKEPNVMQILNKYLVSADGVPSLSYKIFNDPAVFNAWYSKAPEDMLTLGRMYDVANSLQNQLGRIKHPILILSEDSRTLRAITQRLHDIFRDAPNRRYSVWNESTLRLNTDTTNQLQNYLIAKQYWDSTVRIVKPDKAREIVMELRATFPDTPLLDYIFDAEHTVLFNDPLYVPHIKVLQSELLNESNKIMQVVKDLNDITSATNKMETLEDAITLQQYLKDEHGYVLPSFLTKVEITKSYGRFVNTIKHKLDNALLSYSEAVFDATPDVRLLARQEYTQKVEAVLEALNDLKRAHSLHRTQTVLSLTANDYANYLYKYAQGIQVIHLGADMFTDADDAMQDLLKQFNGMLKEAEALGVRSMYNAEADELYVYLDKGLANLTGLEDSAKQFELNNPIDIGDADDIARDYMELVRLLDSQAGGGYGVSMHRAMTDQGYDELVKYLPSSVRDNLIIKDYLDEKDMITGNFNHTVIGDYGYGMGTIFSVYSNNLVTNVAAGFNAVYNHIRGKEMYTTLFFNPEYKLSTWINNLNRLNHTVDYREVKRAIESKGMVLAKLDDNGRVVQVSINNNTQYRRALEDKVMLLDYLSYTRSVEVINNNQINSKLLNFINRNFLSALKVGQLISTGWVLRNISDSTIKGWTQAGLDPAYVLSGITRTRQIMAQYDYTYAKLFEYTKANLTTDNVTEFFAKYNGPDTQLIDEALFKKILTFANSTSSVSSPAQLNLYNNLAYNLYTKVKGNELIKQGDVEEAIRIFTENPNPVDARRIIYETYPESIAVDLLLLKKFIPKKTIDDGWVTKVTDGFLPVKKLMRLNNDFEYFIRLHTFLYHSEYTNGTTANALRMVDKSQFNRARDTKADKVIEMLLPFSSFQLNNMLYWKDTALRTKNNVVAFAEDVVSGAYDNEELDIEELSRNMSLQYLFLSGNLVLNFHDGLNLKTGDSVHSTLALLVNPIDTLSNMLNVPMQVLIDTLAAINADPDAYAENAYENVKPFSEYTGMDKWNLYSQLIPLVGVLYQRYTNAWAKGKLEPSDMILPILMPSVFGVTKLDSAGTTYESRPIGTDWYDRDAEYKKTHRYVFGISYVPTWMGKDPLTYANTFARLQQMGYTAEQASEMMQNGWYMKAPDYILKQYVQGSYGARYPKRFYAKRYYAKRYYGRKVYPKQSYPQRSVLPRKPRRFAMKSSKYYPLQSDRLKMVRGYRVRRIYRTQLYSNRYTRTGVSREQLINWRGANRSSRKLLIDRSKASKMRAQRIMRQIKPS